MNRAGARCTFNVATRGGRTATMGGVGVAAGIDAAMPLLNPAGIAGTPTDMLSVSADVYSASWLKIPSYFRPNGVNAGKFGTVTSVSDESYSIQEIERHAIDRQWLPRRRGLRDRQDRPAGRAGHRP